MSERIAIVGARNHPNLDIVRAYVRTLPAGSVVVSGGAAGVDTVAAGEARACGLTVVEYVPGLDCIECWISEPDKERRALWRHGCGLPRGTSMRDMLIFRNSLIWITATRGASFPDGTRGGTIDAEDQARRFRRPGERRFVDGRVEAFAGGRGR